MNFISLNSNWKFEWNKSMEKIKLYYCFGLQRDLAHPARKWPGPLWRFDPRAQTGEGRNTRRGVAVPPDSRRFARGEGSGRCSRAIRWGSLTGRGRSTAAQLDRWGMTALGRWLGWGGRRNGRVAVPYGGKASGDVGMAGCAVGAPLFGQCGWQAGPTWFHIFLDFLKLIQTCKFKIDAFHWSKNSEIFAW
jgi:hypothetical protein